MWFSLAIERTAAKAGGRERGNHELSGVKVYVEYPKGSVREKTGADGKKWSRKMEADYGRLPGTKGADGDCVDAFIGPKDDFDSVYVLDQVDEEGEFDEHKVILGVGSKAAAKALYLSNYPKGWTAGEITEMSLGEFADWLEDGDMKLPAAER